MSEPSTTSPRLGLLVAGITLVAFNLRTALASVGPLVEEIRVATGLSSPSLGALTTLPLLAFALLSVPASVLGRRLGVERTIGLGVLLIAAGTALRGLPGVAPLFLGTGLLGVGVAAGNVLLPAMAKSRFSDSPGPITSLYSGMMGVGAALAAGLSVPLAGWLGWRAGLGLWAVPAMAALLLWIPVMRGGGQGTSAPVKADQLPAMLRTGLAWQIAGYMGLQSLSFYVVLAWLPALLQAQGMTEAAAGGLLALSQVTGIAGSVLIPVWAGRTHDQRAIILTLGGLEAVGLTGLLLPGGQWATAWVSLLGFVLGGTFALALTLLVLRTETSSAAAGLSGMAQSLGYLLAAAGPPLIGAVHDRVGGWTFMVYILMGVLALKVMAGLPASRRRDLLAQKRPPEP